MQERFDFFGSVFIEFYDQFSPCRSLLQEGMPAEGFCVYYDKQCAAPPADLKCVETARLCKTVPDL